MDTLRDRMESDLDDYHGNGWPMDALRERMESDLDVTVS